MEDLLYLSEVKTLGGIILNGLLLFSALLAGSALVNLAGPKARFEKKSWWALLAVNVLFACGFVLLAFLHFDIHRALPLELPAEAARLLNQQLSAMNQGAAFGLPLYDAAEPPRYSIPLWIENEKYYFWFFCYALLALVAHRRLDDHRFRAAIHLALAVQVAILALVADPFGEPLPRFFQEIAPWFELPASSMARAGLFMQLYPRLVFYYNASYMWFHPPLLFLSYACVTLTFVCSLFMLHRRDPAIERLGYDFAKLGFFMLTLGMLLGYPWALQAWGPNWWWDPKICSSIMMWAVYSTYLHARLYANKPFMWYFSSILGIVCFLAMLFTFVSTFFFPGEHTLQ